MKTIIALILVFFPTIAIAQTLPTSYPMDIGNKWEYIGWRTMIDSPKTSTGDTTYFYTKVEIIKKDIFLDEEVLQVKTSQTMINSVDTLFAYDWYKIDGEDLKGVANWSNSVGILNFNVASLFKINNDNSFSAYIDTFEVVSWDVLILDFPLYIGKQWFYSKDWIQKSVISIDTLIIDENVLPSYKIKYEISDAEIIMWYSAFGKTRLLWNSTQIRTDELGNENGIFWTTSYNELISHSFPLIETNIKVDNYINKTPSVYILSQNYPNPFNPETMIKYQLPKTSNVTLKIYNILGQEIKTLVNEEQQVGYYSVKWDGTNNNGLKVNSGVYIYKIIADNFTDVKKMILLK